MSELTERLSREGLVADIERLERERDGWRRVSSKARAYGPQEHYLVCNANHEEAIGGNACICWRLYRDEKQQAEARVREAAAEIERLEQVAKMCGDTADIQTRKLLGVKARVRELETEHQQVLEVLAPGKEYTLTHEAKSWEECPEWNTTLLERARNVVVALDTETAEGDRARAKVRELEAQVETLADPALRATLADIQAGRIQSLTDVDAQRAVDQRVIGHGEGQEHTIADVNEGLVDDLIQPRLQRAVEAERAWFFELIDSFWERLPSEASEEMHDAVAQRARGQGQGEKGGGA